jgi:hypothetical protein
MSTRALATLVLLSAALLAPGAQAQQPKGGERTAQSSKERRPRGVITLAEVTITGRIQKPIAAIDVARLSPRLTLSELRQPFVDRIAKSIYNDPL